MDAPVVLLPLPDHDFDPTEASIPWQQCIKQGWKVVISTEHGEMAECDRYKIEGILPGILRASPGARDAYRELQADASYQHPIHYDQIDPGEYTALILPGGDGLRMKQYLESSTVQAKVLEFSRLQKLVGAICHGILVLARTVDPEAGKSVLFGHKITVLPKSLDRLAYRLDSLTVNHGYIMYSCCVEDEVSACMAKPDDLIKGSGIFKPFVVSDGNLVTSRWSGDAELFAERFVEILKKRILTSTN